MSPLCIHSIRTIAACVAPPCISQRYASSRRRRPPARLFSLPRCQIGSRSFCTLCSCCIGCFALPRSIFVCLGSPCRSACAGRLRRWPPDRLRLCPDRCVCCSSGVLPLFVCVVVCNAFSWLLWCSSCCCCAVCVACDIGSDSTQGFAVVATVLERNTGYCILKRLLCQ